MPDQDFANVTFRDFYDARRNRAAFRDRVAAVISGEMGKLMPPLKLIGENEGNDVWSFGEDSFVANGVRGARELVAAYALYRRAVIAGGGTPSEFEKPTKDGFE